MKSHNKLTIFLTFFTIINTNAWAHGDHIEATQTSTHASATVYSNPAYSLGIYGYPNPSEQQAASELQLIYQNTADGQSIHSYARTIEKNQSTGTLNNFVEKTYSESYEPILSGDNVDALLHEHTTTQEN
jgi:hypothetical protein